VSQCRKQEKNLQPKFETKWYVFYTFPRAEKVVHQELIKKDYDVFLPMIKTTRVWKNRQKKKIEQILFPNYIFVNIPQNKICEILSVKRIVAYVHCAGVPSSLSLIEIEGIKKVLSSGENVSIETGFMEGQEVRIIEGPLTGQQGILIEQKGKSRFGIQLKEIKHTILIDVSSTILEKI
jgi:transcription antitermination factor NusG